MEPPRQRARRPRGRPPKEHALQDKARAMLLRTGLEIVTEKGFSAVGLEELLQPANVPKGSFYHYFGSKSAYGLALIDEYAAYFARKLDHHLLDASRPPLARLRTFIAAARAGMARHSYRRGCLVGNLGQEMAVLPEKFRARLIGVLEDWQLRVSACLRAAQIEGAVTAEADCDQLAVIFWTGWEGAVLRAKLEQGPRPLDLFAEGFFLMLAAPGAISPHMQHKGDDDV